MPKEQVTTPAVPEPALLYSQAIRANGFVFIAGQVPLDREGNLVGAGDVAAQCRQVFENIKALTEAAGATLADVVKLTVFLKDVADAPAIRPLRQEYFGDGAYPAVTLIGNVALARPEWLLEIEAIVAV